LICSCRVERLIEESTPNKTSARLALTTNGRYLDMLTIARDIANCKHALKFAAPYILCKTCRGKGCDVCHKTGWLSQHALTRNALCNDGDDEQIGNDHQELEND
jgi:hypothetical protein